MEDFATYRQRANDDFEDFSAFLAMMALYGSAFFLL